MDSWNDKKYFIIFIDYSSLSKLWEVLVFRHLVFQSWSWTSTIGKKIMIVKSYRWKYYGTYDIRCNVWSLPCIFFNNCGIVLQHIMLDKQTYHEQSCRMMKLDLYKYGKKFDSSLPKSLQGKTLKNAIYIFLGYQLK